jgi:hypothetical protein
MSSPFRTLLAIVTVSIVAGCGFTKGKEVATKAVDKFHQQFNDSKFTEIYSATTPAFKTAGKEADFMKFIQAVRRKLGAFKSSTSSGWSANATTSGTFMTLTFKSDFEQGSAVETFTFVVSGASATLQGYNVNSPKLITD